MQRVILKQYPEPQEINDKKVISKTSKGPTASWFQVHCKLTQFRRDYELRLGRIWIIVLFFLVYLYPLSFNPLSALLCLPTSQATKSDKVINRRSRKKELIIQAT